MSKTTYQIYQSTDASVINDTIELTISEPSTGSGKASLTIGKQTLGPLAMSNWTCFDQDQGMIWVFTPDVICERNSDFFENCNGKNPSTYSSMIGYTFSPMAASRADLTVPNGSSGTAGEGTD